MSKKNTDNSQKFKFCFSQEDTNTLVMLCQPQQIVSKLLREPPIIGYFWVYSDLPRIGKTLESVGEDIRKNSTVLCDLNWMGKIKENDNFEKAIIICDGNMASHALSVVKRNQKFLGVVQYQIKEDKDPQTQIELSNFESDLQIEENEQININQSNEDLVSIKKPRNIEQLRECLHINSWIQAEQKQFPNFVSIRYNFEKSNVIMQTILAMMNQPIDEQTRQQLVTELIAVSNILCEHHPKLSKKKKHLEFALEELRKGRLSCEKAIKFYSSENYGLYILLNSFLRALACPTEIFYIQPFFKDLFCAVQEIHQSQPIQSIVCYRGGVMFPDEKQRLFKNVGQFVQILGFFSTSLQEQTARYFMKNVFYEIRDEGGPNDVRLNFGYANISKFSDFFDQKEVIFNPLNQFKILQISASISQQKYTLFEETEFRVILDYFRKRKIENQIQNAQLMYRFKKSSSQETQGDVLSYDYKRQDIALVYWSQFSKIASDLEESLKVEFNSSILDNIQSETLKRKLFEQAVFSINKGELQKSKILKGLGKVEQALGLLRKCQNYFTSKKQEKILAYVDFNQSLLRCLINLGYSEQALAVAIKLKNEVTTKLKQYKVSIVVYFYESKALVMLGRHKEALELLLYCEKMINEKLGNKNNFYFEVLEMIADMLAYTNNTQQALYFLQQAYYFFQQMFGQQHISCLHFLCKISFFLKNANPIQSLRLIRYCYDLYKKMYCCKDELYFQIITQHCVCLFLLDRYHQCLECVQQHQDDFRTILGVDHRLYCQLIRSQADCFFSLGSWQASITLYLQCLKTLSKQNNRNIQNYCLLINNLSVALKYCGFVDEALQTLRKNQNIVRSFYGTHCFQYIRYLRNICRCLYLKGQFCQAVKTSERCVALCLSNINWEYVKVFCYLEVQFLTQILRQKGQFRLCEIFFNKYWKYISFVKNSEIGTILGNQIRQKSKKTRQKVKKKKRKYTQKKNFLSFQQ